MATRFEWIKLILDKWATIVPMLLFMGSAVGWGVTSIESTEKDELTEAMKDQIEVLVDYDPKAKAPVKQSCNCNAAIRRLIKQHEKKHKAEH